MDNDKNIKVVWVVSEYGACCASRPVCVFLTEESMHAWFKKQSNPRDYTWDEVDVLE
jgi:hypothetical protein